MGKPNTYLSPLKFIERSTELSTGTLVGLWIGMVFAFAAVYFALSSIGDGAHGVSGLSLESPLVRYADSLYFSVVTATTVGYGDITPLGFSRAIAATEGVLGFFLFAVVISKLVSRKQEIALYNVHKLAFQDTFFTTREGFFVLRRDCDALLTYAEKNRSLDEKRWNNLCIAYQKGQTLLEGVLDFYDDLELYPIDARRELLLLDTVHRTIVRVTALLRSFDQIGIAWRAHAECVTEVRGFTELARNVVERWRLRTPHRNELWFRKLGEATARLEEAAK